MTTKIEEAKNGFKWGFLRGPKQKMKDCGEFRIVDTFTVVKWTWYKVEGKNYWSEGDVPQEDIINIGWVYSKDLIFL